jgi:hypothetical protein
MFVPEGSVGSSLVLFLVTWVCSFDLVGVWLRLKWGSLMGLYCCCSSFRPLLPTSLEQTLLAIYHKPNSSPSPGSPTPIDPTINPHRTHSSVSTTLSSSNHNAIDVIVKLTTFILILVIRVIIQASSLSPVVKNPTGGN